MIRYVGLDEKEEWNQFVYQSPDGHLGHLFQWGVLLNKTFNFPVYHLAYGQKGNIKGVCTLAYQKSFFFGKNLISLSFLNQSGILTDSDEVKETLYNEALNLATRLGAQFLEFRELQPKLNIPTYRNHKVTFLLDLPSDPDVLWKALKDKLRNQIRKGEKEELVFKVLNHNQIDQFYRLFSLNMKNLGTPVFSIKLFKNILSEFKNEVSLYGVFYKEKLVSTGLTLTYKNKMDIPWAASDKKYYQKNLNVYLYWQILNEAIKNNVKVFDFGRCSKTSGTYNFKKQWGGKEFPLYWYYWTASKSSIPSVTNVESPSRKLFSQLWRCLPLFVANQVGPLLSKKMPV